MILCTENATLAGVALWIECQLDAWSGHMPGLWAGPQLGTCERQPINVSLVHQCFSLSLSPFLPPSKK